MPLIRLEVTDFMVTGDSQKIDLQKLQDLVINGKNYCHDLVVIESKDPKTLDLHVDGVKINIAKTLPKFVQLNFEINAISSEPLDVPADAATSDKKQFSHIINITTSSVLDKKFMDMLMPSASEEGGEPDETSGGREPAGGGRRRTRSQRRKSSHR